MTPINSKISPIFNGYNLSTTNSVNVHTSLKQTRFSGNIQSRSEKDYQEAEKELHIVLSDPNISRDIRAQANKKYELLKKESGKAKAIRDTTEWLFGITGAGAGIITVLEPSTASKIGMLASVVGKPIGVLLANIVCKDKNGKNFIDKYWDRVNENYDFWHPSHGIY